MPRYTIRSTPEGTHKVEYNCPQCGAILESLLSDAGTPNDCSVCQAQFRVPGILEWQKLEEKQRERERTAKSKQMAEESSKRQEEARRQKFERHQREQHLAKERSAEIRQKAIRGIHRETFADRALQTAFRLAKAISVLVVTAGLGVAVISAAMGVLTFQGSPSIPVSTLQTPSLNSYREAITPYNSSSSNSQSPMAASSVRSETPVDKLTRIANQYKLESYSIDHVRDTYLRARNVRTHTAFIDDLAAFLTEVQRSGQSINRYTFDWFIQRYDEALDEVNSAAIRLEAEKIRLATEASQRRWMCFATFAVSIAAVLAFLFLPLLIQVEQNTRWSYTRLAALGE